MLFSGLIATGCQAVIFNQDPLTFSGCLLYIPWSACGRPTVTLPVLFTPHFVLRAFFFQCKSKLVCSLYGNRLPHHMVYLAFEPKADILVTLLHIVGFQMLRHNVLCLNFLSHSHLSSLTLAKQHNYYFFPFQSLDLNLSCIVNKTWRLQTQLKANAFMCMWVFVESPNTQNKSMGDLPDVSSLFIPESPSQSTSGSLQMAFYPLGEV